MMDVIRSSEKSVLTRVTRVNIPEDEIPYIYMPYVCTDRSDYARLRVYVMSLARNLRVRWGLHCYEVTDGVPNVRTII
jgi:hypothetical protein